MDQIDLHAFIGKKTNIGDLVFLIHEHFAKLLLYLVMVSVIIFKAK